MIQTVLAINGEDCTIGSGNTAEEYEAIAVTLLRAAEAIRNREDGGLECIGQGGMNSYAGDESKCQSRESRKHIQ